MLGADPAETTFAVSALELPNGQNLNKVRLLATGFVENTMRNLTSSIKVRGKGAKRGLLPPLEEGQAKFIDDFLQLAYCWNITDLTWERYQSRGLRTTSIETIGFMGGNMTTLCSLLGIKVLAPIASEWKQAVNRAGGDKETLDNVYAYGDSYKIPHHTVDSIGIGLYGLTHNDSGKEPFPLQVFLRLVKDVCENRQALEIWNLPT